MLVAGKPYRSLWVAEDGWSVEIVDQTTLPHALTTRRLATLEDVVTAIRTMQVRGAPLIGVAAAFGMALAMRSDASDGAIDRARRALIKTRPTALNLGAAVAEMCRLLEVRPASERHRAALMRAKLLIDAEVEISRNIAEHGVKLLADIAEEKGKGGRVHVLTHCNAGWLATIDWGTALAPIYLASERRIPLHVWVGETRPRNQGMLTAWELAEQGISHTVIVDNEGGHLMQNGNVDLCIVGTDRVTKNGDVCNKIGTYLKALAARDNQIPFYVAAPSTSIDWKLSDARKIPIEERDPMEVHEVAGRTEDGVSTRVRVTPSESPARNDAFDVTPARLVTGFITERGRCAATPEGLAGLFPEKQA